MSELECMWCRLLSSNNRSCRKDMRVLIVYIKSCHPLVVCVYLKITALNFLFNFETPTDIVWVPILHLVVMKFSCRTTFSDTYFSWPFSDDTVYKSYYGISKGELSIYIRVTTDQLRLDQRFLVIDSAHCFFFWCESNTTIKFARHSSVGRILSGRGRLFLSTTFYPL